MRICVALLRSIEMRFKPRCRSCSNQVTTLPYDQNDHIKLLSAREYDTDRMCASGAEVGREIDALI